jgi:hypothetical protein
MASTPNFNWATPDNTGLVKNGALDIRTLGNSIDASMVDLKGGTTGQILSKASNTDMDFAWVADAGGISPTIVDAKGDLIAASAADTPARLAVGANGETLVADSSTSTGLRWQGDYAAGKQMLLNANYDIWQRGTSFASTGYMCDRWQDGNSSSNVTASRQTTGAPVGSQYYLRYTSTGGTSYKNLMQLFETSQSTWTWGKTLTFSIRLRRNATLSGGNINVMIDKSVTTDAGAGATWVNLVETQVAVSSIPTGTTSSDWITATATATIPSDGTANSIRVHCSYSAAQASGSILEFAQPQLEVGALRTAFQTATGTIQGELAACQRYYRRFNAGGSASYLGFGSAFSTTKITASFYTGTMRITPTTLDYNAINVADGVSGYASTAASLVAATSTPDVASVDFTVASGLTQYRPYFAQANGTTSYVGFSAEL